MERACFVEIFDFKQCVFASITKDLLKIESTKKDHSFLNNHCTLRGHSIIMFALRGGRWWGPSKLECMKIGREEVASIQTFTHIFS